VWRVGRFVPFEHGSLEGPARLRLHVGVTPGTQEVELNYLGERLAEVRLPASLRSRGGPGPHSTEGVLGRPLSEGRSPITLESLG
jgi:hypothetical protein